MLHDNGYLEPLSLNEEKLNDGDPAESAWCLVLKAVSKKYVSLSKLHGS